MAKEKREIIALKCKECNQKNYTVYKSNNLKEKKQRAKKEVKENIKIEIKKEMAIIRYKS